MALSDGSDREPTAAELARLRGTLRGYARNQRAIAPRATAKPPSTAANGARFTERVRRLLFTS